jgi:hypothetical protein
MDISLIIAWAAGIPVTYCELRVVKEFAKDMNDAKISGSES